MKYFLLFLMLMPFVSAYCYDIDIRPIDNVTGQCYLNGTQLCVDQRQIEIDSFCTINYIKYVDTLTIDQQRMLGIVNRNLTNITTDIFLEVKRGDRIRYVDRNITLTKYINNTILETVYINNTCENTTTEVIKELENNYNIIWITILTVLVAIIIAFCWHYFRFY